MQQHRGATEDQDRAEHVDEGARMVGPLPRVISQGTRPQTVPGATTSQTRLPNAAKAIFMGTPNVNRC